MGIEKDLHAIERVVIRRMSDYQARECALREILPQVEDKLDRTDIERRIHRHQRAVTKATNMLALLRTVRSLASEL